ncbi:flagellar basal body protein FliL [Actinomycetes bacterium KLBMP 9759]
MTNYGPPGGPPPPYQPYQGQRPDDRTSVLPTDGYRPHLPQPHPPQPHRQSHVQQPHAQPYVTVPTQRRPQDSPPPAWQSQGPGWGGPPPPPPGTGAAPRPRRKRGLVITAVLTVLLLGAGAVFAFQLLGPRDGGASTPGEAVSLLASDLAEGRPLDAYSRLHPAEVRAATDITDAVTAELVRLEVLRPDADPMASYGSLSVTDLRFDDAAAEKVRDHVVINKLVAGKITVTSDPAKLPFTDSFRAVAFPDGVPMGETTPLDITEIVRAQGEPLRIATVQVNGKWYVSALYTAADYALRAAGKPWPTTTVPARGAADPEAALRETVQAALDLDVRRLIELAPPEELQVLHDVGDAIATGPARPTGLEIVELKTVSTPVTGGTALRLTSVVVETPTGDRAAFQRDGDCVTVTAPARPPQRTCADELLSTAGLGSAGLGGTTSTVAPKIARALLDLEVVTVENGGAHYVSPLRTVGAFYVDVLATLSPEEVREFVRASR